MTTQSHRQPPEEKELIFTGEGGNDNEDDNGSDIDNNHKIYYDIHVFDDDNFDNFDVDVDNLFPDQFPTYAMAITTICTLICCYI